MAKAKAAPAAEKKIKVTLVKGLCCCKENQIRTVKALGLCKIRQSNIIPDNAQSRGMIRLVRHLVSVEEVV